MLLQIGGNSVYQLDIDYNVGSNEAGVLVIGLDTDAIVKTHLYLQEIFSSFCARADMAGRRLGFDESISFAETVVLKTSHMHVHAL